MGVEDEEYGEKPGPMVLFAGNSNRKLAEAIAKELGVNLGKARVGRFSDGEVDVQVLESVRDADVYIIQSTCAPVNDNLLELLLMIGAMRRASARRITAVVPYYGYKRDVGAPTHGHEGVARRARRSSFAVEAAVPIAAADVALLLESIGVDRVVCVDLQPPGHGQIEGFFGTKVMVENIETTNRIVEYFRDVLADSDAPVTVLSPNEACVKRARDVQVGLAQSLPDGANRVSLAAIVQGGISRGPDRYFHDPTSNVELVGTVEGADVIITDDMVDSGRTLVSRVRLLKDNGARRVFAFATHGLFTGPATELLEGSGLERVVVTDTVPLPPTAGEGKSSKLVQVSVAPTLAQVIRGLHDDNSIKLLQHNVLVDEPRYADQE